VDRLEGGKENLKARGYELISIFSLNDLGDFSSAGR
jgi:orotate phosphoribosyltransferase